MRRLPALAEAETLHAAAAAAVDTEAARTGGSSAGDFEPTDESEAPSNEPRTDFPETLYVNPALITDSSGKAEVVLPMADVITEWRVSMIANTSGGRRACGR